ncbi:hypothetical protein [Arthrobacter sp. H20]|uniref:hypothetical protein n=1 Tax=Arthrobacter sp. H20 TaxID=1267981 RepID=UPI00047B19EF|nr:hypothetical protein [Arthrobacter sp. H20]
MKKEIWLYVGGLVAFFLSTLFIPQGISDFARAAALEEAVPSGAGLNLGVGALLVAVAISLLASGYVIRRKQLKTTRSYGSDDPDEITQQRPTFGHTNRPAWMDRPGGHMGDNTGDKRD